MRDPQRIDDVLAAVRTAWVVAPDLRLGQLIYNAVAAAEGSSPPCPPLFYMEDDRLVAALRPGTDV